MKNTRLHSSVRPRRGFTLTEAAAVAAVVAVATSITVPVFRRVGCSAMRKQSQAQLMTIAAAHAAYAVDFDGRQFTACPKDLGLFGGDFAAYQAANGCVPPLTLGTSANGRTTILGYGTGSCAGTASGGAFQIPLNFTGPNVGQGSFRWTNVRQFNTYVGGRFYDQTFYAPDDPAMTRKVQRWITRESDFEQDAQSGIVNSTYDYSPAAMFDPRVLGEGTNPAWPLWQNPNTVANGEGYMSPSNAQCLHPSLKTRLLERHCMEPFLGMNPQVPDGRTPYQWNHSFRARGYAAFFDGSVRLFTTAEAMDSEARARVPGANAPARLWIRTSPLGHLGFFGNLSDDFIVKTSAHYLTASGIRGRDTLSPP